MQRKLNCFTNLFVFLIHTNFFGISIVQGRRENHVNVIIPNISNPGVTPGYCHGSNMCHTNMMGYSGNPGVPGIPGVGGVQGMNTLNYGMYPGAAPGGQWESYTKSARMTPGTSWQGYSMNPQNPPGGVGYGYYQDSQVPPVGTGYGYYQGSQYPPAGNFNGYYQGSQFPPGGVGYGYPQSSQIPPGMNSQYSGVAAGSTPGMEYYESGQKFTPGPGGYGMIPGAGQVVPQFDQYGNTINSYQAAGYGSYNSQYGGYAGVPQIRNPYRYRGSYGSYRNRYSGQYDDGYRYRFRFRNPIRHLFSRRPDVKVNVYNSVNGGHIPAM